MWKVITSSNLNPPLKLFFYSPILTNNNLLLKIYCENIVVKFLNYIFYSLYYFPFSPPSFHPYVFLFSSFSPPHVVLPYPYPPSFLSSSSFNTALLFSLFFLQCFFFFLLQRSHSLFLFFSSALSLFFFFFT